MMASTHAAIGAVTYAGACAVTGAAPDPATLAAAAIGALLPDVDTPTSRAGFCVYPLAAFLEKKFGHRTITHSFLGTAIFAALAAPLLFWRGAALDLQAIYFALVLGYASHLLADAATKSGVPMGWPNRRAWVFPGNESYRVRTGSAAELGVLLAFLLIGMLTIPIQRLGVRRILHLATNSLGGAVRDSEDWSEWRQTARVEGYDVMNQKVVEGTFPVVGRRDDGTLVIERDDGQSGYWLLKEGGTELHRIAPRSVRIEKAGPASSETRIVRVSNLSFRALATALIRTTPKGITGEEDSGLFPPASGSKPGFSGSVYLHPILISGEGQCWPLPQDPQHAPIDFPQFGMRAVHFEDRKVSFDFAQPRHLTGAGLRVALRSATLSIKLSKGAHLPRLDFPTNRRDVVARSMLRHGDLLVRTGDLLRKGAILNRTFGQSFEHRLTPTEEDQQRAADGARRDLVALEAEEIALKRRAAPTWGQMIEAYRARRQSLETAAAWTPPVDSQQKVPPPAVAPFDCVVENLEWEPPSTPTRAGEVAEQSAKLSLVQIHDTLKETP